MKRRILSTITALALCLSLCPTWAFAYEGEWEPDTGTDTGLCAHHTEHTDTCGYIAPTEGNGCGHEHTDECCTIAEDGGEVLDCQHEHDEACGYIQATPGASCGYECPLCPIEALIAALPRWVTEDNAETVRWQLDEILDLWRELSEDEQEQIGMTLCWDLLAALDEANAPALVDGEVSAAYQKASWNGSAVTYSNQTAASCTPVADSTAAVTWETGWYVVNSTVTISQPITVSGAVNLILADGCTLNAAQGIVVTTGNSLTIYAQSGGTGTLNATGVADNNKNASAGIGGTPDNPNSGAVTIHGGTVNATGGGTSGGLGGAGIGGGSPNSGNGGNSGAITIYGGTVTANSGQGGNTGAGIGGGAGGNDNGNGGDGSNITIYGGSVTATGGTNGAGIGGGAGASGDGGDGTEITISGGSVNATGGNKGAGIGGGGCRAGSTSGAGTNITISGGEVTAVGGRCAAGIGGGGGMKFSSSTYIGGTGTGISITGGIVDANGGDGNSSGEYKGDPIGNGGNASTPADVTRSAGIIFENGAGKVYGTVALDENYDVPNGYSLTISAGASLSGSGTLSGGGEFKTEDVTADMISGTEGLVYDGTDQTAKIKLEGSVEICGVEFTADTTGWTMSIAPSVVKEAGSYTVTLEKEGNTPITKTFTVAACSHTGLVYEAQANNKHGGTCTICNTEVSEEHTWENGVCSVCNSKAVAKVEIDNATTYYGKFDDAWTAAKGGESIVTLLDDVTASSPLMVDQGDDITFDGGSNTLSIQGFMVYGGQLNITSGTFIGNSTVLMVLSGTVNLSGGEFRCDDDLAHTISCATVTVASLLSNYGSTNAAEKHYAYYRDGGPISLVDGSGTLFDTVTVGECEHKDVKLTPNGDGTHTLKCPYCGYNEAAEGCKYSFTENKGTCQTCGDALTVEAAGTDGLKYDGTAKEPTVTVKRGDAELATSAYTVNYADNKNAGDASVRVTIGTNQGTYDTTFKIGQASLTIKAADQTIAFGQSIVEATNQVTLTGLCSGDSLDSITLTPSTDNVPGGTIEPSDAVIKNASGEDVAGNYQITYETGKLTITPVEVALTFGDQTITYGDTPTPATADPASAVIAYSYTGTSSGDGWPTDVGTYTVTATVEANGNYGAASATATLTINPKTVSATVAAEPDSYVYTGEAITPTKIVVKDGNTVIPASEYTVEYSNNTNVGTATVTITDKDGGNYTVSGSTTFTITAKPLTGAAVNVFGTFTYSGNAHTPEPTVTLGGRTLTNGTDYTVSYSDNVDAGTATITITGKGNYSGTASGEFTIRKATLTADGTGIASGTYGKKLSELTVEGLTAKLNGEKVQGSWALTGETIPDVGDSRTYTATFTPASGAGNYETLTAQVTLNISKVDYTGIKTANTSAKFGLTKTYDLKDLLPAGYELGTVTVSDSNSIFDGTPSVSGTTLTYKLVDDKNNVDKTGDIIIPVTSSTNYNAFNLTLTVTVTNVQVPDLKVNPISVTYTGSPVPNSSISGTATVDGQPISGIWSFVEGQNITNVSDSGTKQVKFTPGNTDLYGPNTGTVTVTISKATPSLSLTASPTTLPNGGTVTLTLSGLPADGSATVTCSDENISVTKGTGNTWTADLPAGGASYTFTASYAGDGNHNSATANCIVSVEKITPKLSLTAAPDSLIGGGTVTLTLTGLPAGGSATVTCSNGITVTAGAGNTWTATLPNSTATYTFTASYGGNSSYNAASASCTVTVKEVVILPDPPADDGDTKFQLVMETEISEVPEGLKGVEGLETPEKLVTAMKTAITEANSGVSQANISVYDVELMVSTDGGSTWTPATTENFPSGGLVVTLPYPDGTNSGYKFTVVHMFTSGDLGHNPGETEKPAVTNTPDGIRFTVSGLSPISVGWEQPSTPSVPSGPSISNPGGGGGGSVTTYAITVEKSEHGKVTSNRVNASSNSTVTLTATPDTGYVLDTLTVTDSRGNEIKLTAQGGGKYTFTMPSRAVNVKASFAPLPADVEQPCDGGAACPSHGFTDLGTVGTWYHEAVDYVLRNGLMNGYSSTMFGPNDNLSRAQLAQILYNKEGKPLVTSGSVFTDVADGQWYAPAITWAAANGIVGGYGNGRFGPDDNITREQLAVMLWRYAESPAATDKELHFTDADQASGYALEALRWASENGILNGYGDGRLNPGGLATRAQVAQMLKNFLKNE